jgi:hypothetical protein
MRNGFHHGYLFNGNSKRSSGHVMAALKGYGSHQEMRPDNSNKNYFDDKSG